MRDVFVTYFGQSLLHTCVTLFFPLAYLIMAIFHVLTENVIVLPSVKFHSPLNGPLQLCRSDFSLALSGHCICAWEATLDRETWGILEVGGPCLNNIRGQ